MTLSILLQGAESSGGLFGSGGPLLMILLLFVIMWFFMIRPQQKRQKEIEKQRAALRTGDKVVTSGGIHGKLKEINDADYVVEIAEGVKVKIDKASVFAAPNDNSSSR
jgi:preprotein translocase subunit YajC